MSSSIMEKVIVGVVTAVVLGGLTLLWNWGSKGGVVQALGGVTHQQAADMIAAAPKGLDEAAVKALIAEAPTGLDEAAVDAKIEAANLVGSPDFEAMPPGAVVAFDFD